MIKLVLNSFPATLDVTQLDSFSGSTLGLEPVSVPFLIWLVGREGLSHVRVSVVFLVDQVVGSSYMIVTIGFETSDRVLFLKLEIIDESLQ